MQNDSQNKMMTGAPKEKTLFHFSGDDIFWAKAILAHTIQEAEKIWHATKVPIATTSSAPAAQPPIPAPITEEKVEDKPIETTNE